MNLNDEFSGFYNDIKIQQKALEDFNATIMEVNSNLSKCTPRQLKKYKKTIKNKISNTYIDNAEYEGTVIGCFYKWIYINLFTEKKWTLSSFTRLTSLPGEYIITFLGNANINEMTLVEWEDMYTLIFTICGGKENEAVYADVVSTIITFHKYMHSITKKDKEKIKIDFSEIVNISTSSRKPKANYITFSEYEKILQYFLHLSSQGDQDAHICAVIVCFAYHCGLRRDEVRGLMIQDVHYKFEFMLFIKSSLIRETKTPNANRGIPLEPFLNRYELDIITSFLKTRLDESENKYSSPLFIDDLSNIINKKKHFTRITAALKFVTNDSSMCFQQFRHSFATRILLYLTLDVGKNWEIPPQLKGIIDIEVLKKVRTMFFPETAIYDPQFNDNALWQLAEILGHSSPKVGLAFYIHLSDFINWSSSYHHAPKGISVSQVESLFNIKSSRRCELGLLKDTSTGLVPIDKLVAYLDERNPISRNPYEAVVIKHAETLLIGDDFTHEAQLVDKLFCQNACLHKEQTSHHNHQFMLAANLVYSNSNYISNKNKAIFNLTPQFPKNIEDYFKSRVLLHTLLTSYSKVENKKIIDHWLRRYHSQRTYNDKSYKTSDINDALNYVSFLSSIGISQDNIHLYHYPHTKSLNLGYTQKQWLSQLSFSKSKISLRGKGCHRNSSQLGMIGIVVVNDKPSSVQDASPITSPVFPFVMHMFAIYSFMNN